MMKIPSKTTIITFTFMSLLCSVSTSSVATTQEGLTNIDAQQSVDIPPIKLPDLDNLFNKIDKEKGIKVIKNGEKDAKVATTIKSFSKPEASAITSKANLGSDANSEQYRKQLIARLSKEIQLDSEDYINHPRVGFLSSLTTDKQKIAYLNELATRLQQVGTNNIPSITINDGVQESVIVNITLDTEGRLLDASISQSSSIKALDKAVLDIIKLSAPFRPLPENMSRHYDQVSIVRTFLFSGG